VKEEICELGNEIDTFDKTKIEEEMGDLLFSLINVSRLYGIDPENALEKTNKKFISRFNYVESKALEQGKKLRDMTLGEMDELWNEAKMIERRTN
jgi:XTP/dITP diphosphohydrolase